ncbi:hypothetical protein F5884DRAFT_766865 [Xylogone sp. PMI_703]|nr:hypothetical protein F5884DRAFT_766865 [Xylogone sp. PMI_703]
MSESPKNKAKQSREPPPSLFLGPPSQNASHISLPGSLSGVPTSNPPRVPLIQQRSQRLVPHALESQADAGGSSRPPLIQVFDSQKQAARTDALWAEMQSTLEEVELNAANTTHIFGPRHNEAIEELRKAQIELAKAWARTEADDAGESKQENKLGRAMYGSEGMSGPDGTEAGKSTAPSGSAGPGSTAGAATERRNLKLEEETEADILLARKRREANDKYFQQVNGGVLEVVAKLEDIARAMKSVEQEIKEIWGESDNTSVTNESIH